MTPHSLRNLRKTWIPNVSQYHISQTPNVTWTDCQLSVFVPCLYPCNNCPAKWTCHCCSWTLAALTTALKSLMPNQADIILKTPTFEWTTSYQYDEFKLSGESTESWFHLQAIPEEPDDKGAHLEYILNFLRITDHWKWNQWTPAGVTTTDWVSSLAYSWKANGKLWVCLDPEDLNTAIGHDHYKTPTVEEVTHELAGNPGFTKLDGTSSYLCIVLNYESSLLRTFNTPWGRFRFGCLSWDLACAQDIFQWMMDQILTHCNGVISITDDVVVHGKHENWHDKCLHKFMRVTHEHGLVFIKDKFAVKQTSIVFLAESMMPLEPILTLKRSAQSTRCQHLRQQLNYRSSLDW